MGWKEEKLKISVPDEIINAIKPTIDLLKDSVLDPLVGETYDSSNPTDFPGGIFGPLFDILDALPPGIDSSTNIIGTLLTSFLDSLETVFFDLTNSGLSFFLLCPFMPNIPGTKINQVTGIPELNTGTALSLLQSSFDDENDLLRPQISENGQWFILGILYSADIASTSEFSKIDNFVATLNSLLNFVNLPELEKYKKKFEKASEDAKKEEGIIEDTDETTPPSIKPDWFGITLPQLFPFMKDVNQWFVDMKETVESYISGAEGAIVALKKTIAYKISTLYKFIEDTTELITTFQAASELDSVYVIFGSGTGLDNLKKELNTISSTVRNNNTTLLFTTVCNSTQFKEIENLVGIFNTTLETPIKVGSIIASQDSGTNNNDVEVQLTSLTKDATIYYTLDGTDPFWNPGRLTYSGTPISITNKETVLKTIGYKAGLINSDLFIFNYLYQVFPVEYNIVEVDDEIVRRIELICNTLSVQIRCSFDGTDVTEAAALYSTPIQVSYFIRLRVKGFKTNFDPSTQISLDIGPKVAPVHFYDDITSTELTVGDVYNESFILRLASAITSAEIFYTLDGTDPAIEIDQYSVYKPSNTSTVKYTDPFVIAFNPFINKKITAIAAKRSYDPSNISSANIVFSS